MRTRALVATSGILALPLLAVAIASCAESSAAGNPPEDTITVPEAGSLDAVADGPADAACSTEDGGCATRELTCDEADFCAVPTGVDSRYALLGVRGSSATDVWAVGSAGTIIHWDGTAWTKVPLDRKDTLLGVWASSASDVWVVSSLNVVLRGSGFVSGTATFVERPPIDPDDPTNLNGAILTSVWGAGPDDVFVGGPAANTWPRNSMWRHVPEADGDPASAPHAWEGASTFCKGSRCVDVNAIWGTSASDLWIASNSGMVLRSKGAVGDGGGAEQWTTITTTVTIADLHGIWGSSDSDVWIVGDGGTIRHWSNDGTQRWKIVASPTTENLRAVWGTGPNDAWAVGDSGTILHWDGTTWSVASTALPLGPRPRLYSIWGSGPNDVWVVGEAVALHFTGKKPTPQGEK